MDRPGDYQQPVIESFEEVDVIGDAPETIGTVAAGSYIEIHTS